MRSFKLGAHAIGLLLLLVGCHKLFGEFTVAEGDDGCTLGEVQCAGNVLQRCTAASTWANADVCASETLCDAKQKSCRPPQCTAGEWQCAGTELQICNGTRDGWLTLTNCATEAHCSTRAGMCTDEPCEPGQFQCNSMVLQSCKDDRSGWNDLMQCSSAALCNEDAGECEMSTCELGEFRCQGSELQTCTATLDGWTTIKTCHSEALCDKEAGQCRVESCTNPGAFRCGEGGALERCLDDLTGWALVDTCQSVAHCDAVGGTCMDEPCTPGLFQCSGATLEVCNSERTGWDPVDTCETDALCQLTLAAESSQCQQPVCAPGDFACDGAQPLICNAGRTEFRENGAACLTAELCNSQQGTCSPAACDPGDTRCTSAQPEICNAARTGYVPNGEACASDALCNPETGTCGDARCVEGQWRCDPNDPTLLQRCKSDLSGWDTCDTCASAELCSASIANAVSCGDDACTEPSCALTDRWCGGLGSRALYQCPASRINTQATVLDTCATKELCDLAHAEGMAMCPEPTCAPTDRWCGGDGNTTLYQCPASRINSEPDVVDVCETSGLCALALSQGSAMCPEPSCAPTDRWCGGDGNATLYQCPASRINSQPDVLDVCETGGLCELAHSQGDSECPAPTCASGEKQCNGAQLQICNAGRTGWTNLQMCGSSTLCMNSLMPSSQMTCDACLDGSTRCDGAQPQVCDDPGTGPATWEDDGDTCDAAALCDATTGTCLCSVGDTRCHPETDNFEECQATGWVETDECAMGCDPDMGCLVEEEEEEEEEP